MDEGVIWSFILEKLLHFCGLLTILEYNKNEKTVKIKLYKTLSESKRYFILAFRFLPSALSPHH